jgi:hypothetical protein
VVTVSGLRESASSGASFSFRAACNCQLLLHGTLIPSSSGNDRNIGVQNMTAA